ncbi:MAG TPA: N-acetyltransferase [Rhizomicrobium sp.]|nr:N-acetyltransferase [Rhizomicrobium sp.]
MIAIRNEKPHDSGAIRSITTAAFAAAEHSSGSEAAIVDALRDAGALTISLVAVESREIIGHVAFSPVTIDTRSGGWFGLGPVSVRPDRQGKGVGKALIESGLAQLKAKGADGCVVLGDPRYYSRFGFASDPKLRYGDAPVEYFQRLVFEGPPPAGQVAYHASFGPG